MLQIIHLYLLKILSKNKIIQEENVIVIDNLFKIVNHTNLKKILKIFKKVSFKIYVMIKMRKKI